MESCGEWRNCVCDAQMTGPEHIPYFDLIIKDAPYPNMQTISFNFPVTGKYLFFMACIIKLSKTIE